MNRRELIKAGSAAVAAGEALAQAPVWKPKVFDAHQNETLIALADVIIPATDTPGAKAAGVNRWIDTLLEAGRDEERRRFLDGLALLDGYMLRTHRQPFVKCTLQQQRLALEAFDGGSDPDLARGKEFFQLAKAWISRIYYSTEAGYRELNKGGRVPAGFGCTHPEHKGSA
jgi:hypothetical protein